MRSPSPPTGNDLIMEDPVYVGWPEVFSAYLFVLLAWFVRRAFEVLDTFLP